MITGPPHATLASELEFFNRRWKAEYPAFIRVMEALPADALAYRPHPRSRSAAELLQVLVQEALAASILLDAAEFYWREVAAVVDLDAAIDAYRRHHAALTHRFATMEAATWSRPARFYENGHIAIEAATGEIVWLLFFDAIHHRGQLSTYIRPMGGKVPSIYGPSGDES